MSADLIKDWLRHRTGRFTAVLGVYTLLFILWVAFGASRLPYRVAIGDLALPLMALVAASAAWRIGSHPSLRGRAHLAWRSVALALVFYGASDVVRAYYEVWLGLETFPSKTNIGYLLFYPTLTLGLLSFPQASRPRGSRLAFWLDAGAVLLGGWMIIWYFVLGPSAFAEQTDLTTTVLAIAYPVGDLALVFGVAALLLRPRPREHRDALSVLAAGVTAFLIADVTFGYRDLLGLDQTGDWPDAFWMLGWFLIAASALYQSWSLSKPPVAEPNPPEEPETMSWLPYTAIVAGYALLFVAGRDAPPYPLGGLLYSTIAITGLLLLRQRMVLAENRQLRADRNAFATIDSLTGLLNRRQFLALAEREYARYQRHGHPLSVIILDIDEFTSINNQHGEQAGDEVLQVMAELCRQELRRVDLAGRYGGDELALLLPDTDLHDALRIAQRLLSAAGDHPLAFGEHLVKISISGGVSPADGTHNLTTLLARAGEALSTAKQAGRNQVRFSGPGRET
jgi:diguanylate cyclase (GGDEF)-like protein